jgi:putative transposase
MPACLRRSRLAKGRKTYLDLLGGLRVERPNQIWCADITYITMRRGFLYLVAIMERYTRKELAGHIYNALEAVLIFTQK